MPLSKQLGSGPNSMRNHRQYRNSNIQREKAREGDQDFNGTFDASSEPFVGLGQEMLMMLTRMDSHRHFALNGTGVFG